MKKLLIIICAATIMTACAAKNNANVTDISARGYKEELEAYKKQEAEKRKPTASLWRDTGSYGTMFLDYKARNIGDVVIVKIVETSSASNSTSAANSKTTSYSAGITGLLGLPTNLGAKNFLGSGQEFSPTLGANTSNSHSGKGSTQKSDKVTATIAARITDIMPSGNLVIEGNREILIDEEKQTITLKGIVRQKDIDATNTVASTAIADAQITYSGSGATTSATKKGWLGKIIDVIWPF